MALLPPELAPETGSQPRLMEKTRISTGPSARPGTERPKRLTTESAWSKKRPRRTAARIPAGSASASAKTNAVSVSAIV